MPTNEELAEQLRGPSEDLGCKTMPEPGPLDSWLGRVVGDIEQLERVCRRKDRYPAKRAANLYSQRLNEALKLVDSEPGLEVPPLDTEQPVRIRFANLRAWGRSALGQSPDCEESSSAEIGELDEEKVRHLKDFYVETVNGVAMMTALRNRKRPMSTRELERAIMCGERKVRYVKAPLMKAGLVRHPPGKARRFELSPDGQLWLQLHDFVEE